MKKWILILSTLLPFQAFADDCPDGVVRCGTTDDGLSWEISNITDENGQNVILSNGEIAQQLKIKGSGDMQDYQSGTIGCPPWTNSNCRNGSQNSAPSITKVVIEDGITSIGEKAFEYMKNVTSVSLPEGLTTIKNEAFTSCPIAELDLPDSLKTIGNFAFSSSRVSEVILPENLKQIGSAAFYNTTNLRSITIPEKTNVAVSAFAILDGLHDNLIRIQNIYCAGNNASCQALKNNSYMKDKTHFYQSDGDAYFYKNHWYTSPNDIIGYNHIKKRIYTIDEANKVTGTTNNISITYR